MYERFTDPARRVLQLANDEAKRFKHEYIGTEHILLGVLQQEGSIGSKILRNAGVTLDKADATEKINQVMTKNEMTWPQIYDGKFWKARIADMYAINGIPAAFLVDGDSGEIIAAGGSLRGEDLEKTIQEALDKKFGNPKID